MNEFGKVGMPGTKPYRLAAVLSKEFQSPKQLGKKAGLSKPHYNPLEELVAWGIAEKTENPKMYRMGPNYLGFCRKRGITIETDCTESASTAPKPVSPLTSMTLPPPKQVPIPQTIRIDPEVWCALQEHAIPFVETPNDVLRRLLGLGNRINV